MERRIQLHKDNIFNVISHANENERKYLDEIVEKQKIDPVTGEAHYYLCNIQKNKFSYTIKIPRNGNFPTLENNEKIKVIMQREGDNYIVMKVDD